MATLAELAITLNAMDRDGRASGTVPAAVLVEADRQSIAEDDAGKYDGLAQMSENVRECHAKRDIRSPNLTGAAPASTQGATLPPGLTEETANAAGALTPRQKTAVAHLVSGRTVAATAYLVGVNVRTLYRWRRVPLFEESLNRLAHDAMATSAARLRKVMLAATTVLGQLCKGRDREEWAFKIVTSKRIWDAAKPLKDLDIDLDNEPLASNTISG